ncbi:MAG: tRNA (adenosine(37)-N6)-threonylcarbamoyltransferase complex dimerization subunit type 1 TsaB [Alphaproteobacteria bacterium]|nr:tRNA (adenosine(37)-N6)-threonylcarbamoyltransferase complex dimerization subunit type 1 TsaB [Alphaproteobacteria bacterium]
MGEKTYILGFETAGDQFSLALLYFENEKYDTLFSYHEMAYRGHAERLLPVLEEALKEANITKNQLSLIVTGKGPGSFTGVRVGLSAARGLGDSLKIPVAALPVSEVILKSVQEQAEAKRYTAWLTAHGEDVYVQTLEEGALSEIRCMKRAEAIDELQGGQVLCGDGMLEHRSSVPESVVCTSLSYPPAGRYVNAEKLTRYGHEAFLRGEGQDLSPLYVRALSYQTIAEREALKK